MAAVTVELKLRDGQREKISVKVEHSLTSVIRGVHEMNANVSRVLSELMEREKARGDCAREENDEDSDEGNNEPPNLQPPTKKHKT